MTKQQLSNTDQPEGERVRENTSIEKNRKIDAEMLDNIRSYSNSTSEEISARIRKLDKEWDIERVLEINMSTLSIIGILLAVFVNIYWLILPSIVLLFFIQHALQGWCPPIPIFRYYKKRTRPEIDREKYALKALRGDFDNLNNLQAETKAQAALEATKKV